MELVVPKRMSGLTGSSGLRETAADMVDGAMRLAAAVMPDKARAEDTNSRLLVLRSVILTDMGVSSLVAQEIFCTHPVAEWKPLDLDSRTLAGRRLPHSRATISRSSSSCSPVRSGAA